MSKDGAISGAYANASNAQVGGNLYMYVASHSSDKNNECVISWETLIKCVKAKYLQANQIKTILNEAQEIASCYVNLATVEEKEQKEKKKTS